MRLTLLLACIMFVLQGHVWADIQNQGRTPQKASQARRTAEQGVTMSEKGLFSLEAVIPGNDLRVGLNSLELLVRDRTGRAVEGAKLAVVTWMPDMGAGVWEKPLVTEKGGGSYHVENIAVIHSGRWDLRVNIRNGGQEDRAVFRYAVATKDPAPPAKAAKPKGNYSRSLHRYSIPNVTLLNQDGKRVNLKTLTESGKPVIVNFIYTTCTTICPVLSASFTNLRKGLGPDLERFQFVSISIDPEHDRPEQMKRYLARFTTQKGWDFLTGSRDDIGKVLKVFDAYVPDKMSHEPLYLLRGPRSDEWVRIKGLTWSADLMAELRGVEHK